MLAVTDIRLPATCRTALESRGFEVLSLPPFDVLDTPVASHPDMLIFPMGSRLLTHKNYYSAASEELDRLISSTGLELLLSDEPVGRDYPHDVLFNAAPVGDIVFCKRDAVSRHITEHSRGHAIGVRQGYTKCSICTVSDNAIISSDRGIAAAAAGAGVDVLTVTPGHVTLEGYDTGFIGGASGTWGEYVFFCGDLNTHIDSASIRDFCAAHGKTAVSLGNGPLLDVGTIFFFKHKNDR